MKSFKEFKEDAGGAGGAAAVGAASGGAVPANRTGPSVAGTVGDPPVSKKAQKAIQTQSTLSDRTGRVATKPTPSSGVSNRVGPNILETTESPRKIGTVVGFKEFRQKPTVGAGVGPQTFMTKEGLREDTKKAQKEITSANSKALLPATSCVTLS